MCSVCDLKTVYRPFISEWSAEQRAFVRNMRSKYDEFAVRWPASRIFRSRLQERFAAGISDAVAFIHRRAINISHLQIDAGRLCGSEDDWPGKSDQDREAKISSQVCFHTAPAG